MPPTLAVVIPATDDPPTLDRCLAAIAAADDPPDEIVVVTTPRDAGPGGGAERGVPADEADVVVFVDSDVLVHPDVFARIRRAFAARPRPRRRLRLVRRPRRHDAASSPAFRNLLHHAVHQRSAGDVRSFWAGLGAVRARRRSTPPADSTPTGIRTRRSRTSSSAAVSPGKDGSSSTRRSRART